ncbi:cytochrome c oxidase assembly protein [Edaphobacter sp. HDX4]|uniref:cytochrome c oxidase assembly protein n=1 Tax=Edaphobacter sp. HDX4 TaxID=2794064 RepID=UPI002FE5B997
MPHPLLAALLLFHPVATEDGPLPTPADLWAWRNWTWELSITLPLAIGLAWYLIGAIRRGDTSRLLWRHIAFLASWASLCVALVSPLHRLGDALFSAHMLQHEILVLIAAPLLAAAHPAVTFLYGFSSQQRPTVGKAVAAIERHKFVTILMSPLVAWLGHAAALWLWHIPALYQATLSSDAVHSLQHLSFFITSLIFWSALYGAGRSLMSYGAAVFYVFGTAVHSGALGALLTFSTVLWYPLYAGRTAVWGLTPLEDQQLGGLIMWVPSGVVFIVVGLVLFARWLKASNDRLEHSTLLGAHRTSKPVLDETTG